MRAARIHEKSVNIDEALNKWLTDNEDKIARIEHITMSTHTVSGETSGLMIPWADVVILYQPKQEFMFSSGE